MDEGAGGSVTVRCGPGDRGGEGPGAHLGTQRTLSGSQCTTVDKAAEQTASLLDKGEVSERGSCEEQ